MEKRHKDIAEIIRFQLATELTFGEFVTDKELSSELVAIFGRLASALGDGLGLIDTDEFVKIATQHNKRQGK